MDYRDIIESRYNREAWQQLLHDIFRSKVSFWREPSAVHASSRLAKKALNLGKISLADGESIAIYEIELTDNVDIERNRRGIRDMLTTDWRNMGYAGAFMFCYRQNESVLRFSYVSESWGFNKQGEYEKVSTNTKRYTYLMGEGRGCRTAIEQFKNLKNSKQTLSDITAAFSVEALTKQFYNDLFNWYLWAIEPSTNVTFPGDTSTPDDDREDLETKIIRMITRIMFVWFIKQKQLVPEKIFDEDFLSTILKDFDPMSTTVGNYYNAILQNLFFATLNRAIVDEDGSRREFAHIASRDVKNKYRYEELFSISENEVIDLFSTVPFVNGGLFECLDKTRSIDGVEYTFNYDGFSRNDRTFANGRFKHRAIVPNVLFFEPEKGLLSILKRYNFTIEENSPEEQQVALDPELLGKVFENLLGAYNPETQESARNSSGSFYTPREIVNYMIDESLVQYLGDNPVVRSLFADDFTPDETQRNTYEDIATRLKAVKILDPACGSGAFPMGALKRIVEILKRINPKESDYELKLAIIENCIYGSDIQCIATQISKLRFFISLICECDRDEKKPNFGIPVLPNLETKFVAANSLLSKKNRAAQGNLFEDPEIEITKNELAQVRHEHFSAKTTSRKRALRKRDEELRAKLATLLEANHEFAAPQDAIQLAKWNPYDQNAVAEFFDPEWMFGISTGFDIVIGNPPYIQLQKDGGSYAKLYEGCGFETFARTGDMYCLFYERGWQLLKNGGHLCYITSNKWMRAGYGEKTREFFAKKTNPMLLIDFAGVKIFESATVDTNILLFEKGENKHETICAVTNKQNKDSVKNLSVFVQQQHSINDFSSSGSWVILSEIELSIKRKIEAVGTPLKDWDIQIYRGVLTGYNEAFIISTEKRDEILANCHSEEERAKTAELIRPILRGRDIKRYGYEWANLWLIATFPARQYDINNYPAVKNYLLSFAKQQLIDAGYSWVANEHLADYCKQKLSQTGKFIEIDGKRITIGNSQEKARKKTSNKWFETQDSISYWDDFNQPKIIYPNMTKYMPFVFDNNGFLTNQKCFIVTGQYVAFLTAFFNSSLFKYCFRNSFPELLGGTREMSKIFFDKIPVIVINNQLNELFASKIMEIQSNYTRENAKTIDTMIFDLYELTGKERQAIGYIEIQ